MKTAVNLLYFQKVITVLLGLALPSDERRVRQIRRVEAGKVVRAFVISYKAVEREESETARSVVVKHQFNLSLIHI